MGREQGDDLGTEVVYVREHDGKTQERRAYTPADHVNLQARGWVRRDNDQRAKAADQAKAAQAAKPAPAPATPAQPAAPAAGASS
jgi:hypothetical protein